MKIPAWISRINENVVARNLVLAACGIVVFVFLVSMMLNIFTRHGSHKDVPDFIGMDIVDARRDARYASLKVEVNDSIYIAAYPGGTVLDQNPKAGSQVKAGRRIFVTINRYHQRQVEIPYVTGFSLRQAKNNLEVAGLEIDRLVYRPDIATNYVLEERFNGRLITRESHEQTEIGSGVTLIVGMGEAASTVRIPKLVGFPLEEAKSRLWEAGLNVGQIDQEDDITPLNIGQAKVWSQSPEQGYGVSLGTNISFKITLDEEKVAKGSKNSDSSARRIATEEQAAQEEEAQQTGQ